MAFAWEELRQVGAALLVVIVKAIAALVACAMRLEAPLQAGDVLRVLVVQA